MVLKQTSVVSELMVIAINSLRIIEDSDIINYNINYIFIKCGIIYIYWCVFKVIGKVNVYNSNIYQTCSVYIQTLVNAEFICV